MRLSVAEGSGKSFLYILKRKILCTITFIFIISLLGMIISLYVTMAGKGPLPIIQGRKVTRISILQTRYHGDMLLGEPESSSEGLLKKGDTGGRWVFSPETSHSEANLVQWRKKGEMMTK